MRFLLPTLCLPTMQFSCTTMQEWSSMNWLATVPLQHLSAMQPCASSFAAPASQPSLSSKLLLSRQPTYGTLMYHNLSQATWWLSQPEYISGCTV